MTLFKYEAFSEGGTKERGTLNSSSFEEAKTFLNKKGLTILSLKEIKKGRTHKFKEKELLYFTQEISKLLKAGMALYEILLALEEKYKGHRMHLLISDLASRIKEGESLSKAMANHPNNFDLLFRSMVAGAEKTGALDKTLDEIASLIAKRLALKKEMTKAFLYPSILASFCLIVLTTLIFFIIPSLFELFEGRPLHPLTTFVFKVSKIANSMKIELLFSLLALVTTLFLFKKKVKRILLSFPFLKGIMAKNAVIKFCRSMAALLSGGVAYLEALKLAREVANHEILEKEIIKASKQVEEGHHLSELLKSSEVFPPLAARMLAIAEEGGNEAEILRHIANIYEDEMENKLAEISIVIQPLLLLILGVIIGFVVLSVLLPLTDVSSFVQ